MSKTSANRKSRYSAQFSRTEENKKRKIRKHLKNHEGDKTKLDKYI